MTHWTDAAEADIKELVANAERDLKAFFGTGGRSDLPSYRAPADAYYRMCGIAGRLDSMREKLANVLKKKG